MTFTITRSFGSLSNITAQTSWIRRITCTYTFTSSIYLFCFIFNFSPSLHLEFISSLFSFFLTFFLFSFLSDFYILLSHLSLSVSCGFFFFLLSLQLWMFNLIYSNSIFFFSSLFSILNFYISFLFLSLPNLYLYKSLKNGNSLLHNFFKFPNHRRELMRIW